MATELYPERDCSTCTAANKLKWGCDGNATSPDYLNGEPIKTCLRRPIKDNPSQFSEYFTAYKMYKSGYLPNEGAYNDQSVLFLQVINIIDSAISDCDGIKEEGIRRKQQRKRQQLK